MAKKPRKSDAVETYKLESRKAAKAESEQTKAKRIDPERMTPCWMEETNGGGSFEIVEGFDSYFARNYGLPGFSPRRSHARHRLKPEFESSLSGGDLTPINDPTKLPWRSIAFVDIQYENGQVGQGTAFFIGPRALATAGHNIYRPGAGSALSILVSPALGDYGPELGSYEVTRAFAPARWRGSNGADDTGDFGVLEISEVFEAEIGWFGLKPYDSSPGLLPVNISGYPKGMSRQTQYFQAGRISDWSDPNFITYTFDTVGGMSGAPVFAKFGESRQAVGIHTYGGAVRKALRISGEVYEVLSEWAKRR